MSPRLARFHILALAMLLLPAAAEAQTHQRRQGLPEAPLAYSFAAGASEAGRRAEGDQRELRLRLLPEGAFRRLRPCRLEQRQRIDRWHRYRHAHQQWPATLGRIPCALRERAPERLSQ